MLKQIIPFLILVKSLSLHGNQFPLFIDFDPNELQTHFLDQPFNRAPEMSSFFLYIKHAYQIKTVVETGTFKGSTTVFFGSTFNTVHTIEISPEFYSESERYLSFYSNVHCHLGSSPKILQTLLPTLSQEPVLFYLDAHWYADWPLLDELTVIRKTHKDNCIIVIDDFKVPGRKDIPYDTHGDKEYAFEYVKNHLDKLFSGYTIHYLIPSNVNSRAKLVAIPTSFRHTADYSD